MDQQAIFERARLSRDARFDGRFYVGVRTTGVYCRPVCPAVAPKSENVTFFPSAAAASEAGYRPCLRCRPECAPGTPAWNGTSTTVHRGLRLIAGGALDGGSVDELATRLGMTSRHLRRLFVRHVDRPGLDLAGAEPGKFCDGLVIGCLLAAPDRHRSIARCQCPCHAQSDAPVPTSHERDFSTEIKRCVCHCVNSSHSCSFQAF